MSQEMYILNALGEPVPTPDVRTWGQWFEQAREQRIVKQEDIGQSRVSTVFLGLDHNWGAGPPVLWETMVFGGKLDQEQDRCSGTREQAQAMHEKMVERVKTETL